MHEALNNKKIIISGGSSGIGLATAKRLSKRGAEIIVVSRCKEKLDRAKNDIGGKCKAYSLDVTDEKAVDDFFSDVGRFDHLVTAAAGAALGGFTELESQTAISLVESKLWGQYFCAKYAVPQLNDGGSITFFSGIVSRKPMVGASAYAIIAGAMESLTRSLALELAPVRVNCITPGVIDTPVWAELLPDDLRKEQFESIASMLPVNRLGSPDDVSQAVEYVIGNRFVSGSIVDVDGGHRVV